MTDQERRLGEEFEKDLTHLIELGLVTFDGTLDGEGIPGLAVTAAGRALLREAYGGVVN